MAIDPLETDRFQVNLADGPAIREQETVSRSATAVVVSTNDAAEPGSARSPQSDNDTENLDWDELLSRMTACTRCPLHQGRSQVVPGTGDRRADWLIIGEAPGAEEDRVGEPFVGRAGQLLNAMLLAVGLTREQVYIANTLKCRPPSNRNPNNAESDQCFPFLKRQIALIEPKIILLVGKVAVHRMLNTDAPLGKLRGKVYRYQDRIPMIVTYHPAYLLRSPSQKAKVWDDLLLTKSTLAQETGV